MAIRLSMGHVDTYDDRVATFARQLGLSSVQLHAPSNLPGDSGHWRLADLVRLKAECEGAGLVLEGLENVPASQFAKIQRGLPGRDEQLEHYLITMRNMAEAGIYLLGFNFLATYVWRTDMHAVGRGNARVTSFDLEQARRSGNALATYKLTPSDPIDEPITAEMMWANYQYFLDAVLPEAEALGLRLALHPDDPPVDESLGGVSRIFTSPAALVEAHRRSGNSPAWALNLCIGTISEMNGAQSVREVIDALGPIGRIAYVHFRDVQGTVPSFSECFLGEGNYNPADVIRQLHSVGFDGFIIDDHVPAMIGDIDSWGDTSSEAYCSRARAHAIGYLQGVLNGLGLPG
jgi:mannonate dehydratase